MAMDVTERAQLHFLSSSMRNHHFAAHTPLPGKAADGPGVRPVPQWPGAVSSGQAPRPHGGIRNLPSPTVLFL